MEDRKKAMPISYCNYKSEHKFRGSRNTNVVYSSVGQKSGVYLLRLISKATLFLWVEPIFLPLSDCEGWRPSSILTAINEGLSPCHIELSQALSWSLILDSLSSAAFPCPSAWRSLSVYTKFTRLISQFYGYLPP